MTYVIRYDVFALTELDAITKATGLLRSAVRLMGVAECRSKGNGWWTVALNVAEED